LIRANNTRQVPKTKKKIAAGPNKLKQKKKDKTHPSILFLGGPLFA